MNKVKLRKYGADDYEKIIRLFYDTVHSVCTNDYTDLQLNAWAPSEKSFYKLEDRLSTNYAVVVEKDDSIVGFGSINGKDYFDCLYTHRDCQGIGVATLIADNIEKYLYNQGVQVITTDASITAKPFFEKRGYVVQNEQKIERRGQLFVTIKMKKTLQEFAL